MTMLADLFWAILMLGLPMIAVSWMIFSWLFNNAELDRETDRKTMTAALKKVRKSVRKKTDSGNNRAHFLYEKWTFFGGGFYGLAGLWTFVVIEVGQFFGFVFDARSWSTLTENGLLSFLISFALNQLGNMLQGLIWFTYWPAESILLWVLVAWLGYWVGVELARRSLVPQQAILLQQFLSRIRKPSGSDSGEGAE